MSLGGYEYISLNQNLSHLENEETRLREESKKYDKVLREISLLNKEIKIVETRLGVIEGLENDKTGALQILEEVALAAPVERLWLNSLSESKGLLTLQGSAMDNNTVAQFMTSLGKAEHITIVDLKSTQLQDFPQYKLKAATFVLTCKTSFSKPKPEPEKKGAKKGK